MTKKIKKSLQIACFLGAIFVIGGISGVIFERLIMPRLASVDSLNKLRFFKAANENVTIIEKTEEKIIKENTSLSDAAQGVTPAVVKIVRYPEKETPLGPLQKLQKGEVKTGLILTSDGLVVSAMDPADFQGEADSGEDDSPLEVTKVFTSTSGSKPLDAQLVGQDKYWGLEFYRLTESNLPAAPLGDANSLERGEKLIVLNRNTASNLPIFFSGLFQELDQDLCLSQADELASSGPACLSERHQEALLISSLAGEQGLGGPLVDFNGSVMGLTVSSLGRDSSVASPSEEGQLVVISVNRIKDSMARITQEEAVEAGFLGVRYQPITEELAMVNQLPANQGARIVGFYSSSIDQAGEPGRISRVASISPALRAGLQAGDIITQVDDQKATLENPLSEIINQKEAGQEVLVKFFRGEKELEINVTLD